MDLYWWNFTQLKYMTWGMRDSTSLNYIKGDNKYRTENPFDSQFYFCCVLLSNHFRPNLSMVFHFFISYFPAILGQLVCSFSFLIYPTNSGQTCLWFSISYLSNHFKPKLSIVFHFFISIFSTILGQTCSCLWVVRVEVWKKTWEHRWRKLAAHTLSLDLL